MSDFHLIFPVTHAALIPQGDKGDRGDRGLTTTIKGDEFPTGIIEGPPGPPGPPGKCLCNLSAAAAPLLPATVSCPCNLCLFALGFDSHLTRALHLNALNRYSYRWKYICSNSYSCTSGCRETLTLHMYSNALQPISGRGRGRDRLTLLNCQCILSVMSLGIDRVDGFFKSCCGSFYLLPARMRCPLRGVGTVVGRGGRSPESHLIESLTNAVPLGHISGFDFVVVVGCEKQLVKM